MTNEKKNAKVSAPVNIAAEKELTKVSAPVISESVEKEVEADFKDGKEVDKTKNRTANVALPAKEFSRKSSDIKNDTLLYFSEIEGISLNRFLTIMGKMRIEKPFLYAELLNKYGIPLNIELTFDWFKANCPSVCVTEKGLDSEGKEVCTEKRMFAKWVKVNYVTIVKSVFAKENRATTKGVEYTLLPYNQGKASYGIFLNMFCDVANEMKRLEKERMAKAFAAIKLEKLIAKEKADAFKKEAEEKAKEAAEANKMKESLEYLRAHKVDVSAYLSATAS